MPKKLDSLPCREIGQDVPAQPEGEENQEERAEAAVGLGFEYSVRSRWASFQSIGRSLQGPNVSDDDEGLNSQVFRDSKGKAPSCIHQTSSADDPEGPYPSIGFDLPISEITDSVCNFHTRTEVQFDLSWPLEDPSLPSSSLTGSHKSQASSDLIRACHVSKLIAGSGSFLADCQDSQDAFRISSKAEHIDVFLSHNWSMHHKQKLHMLRIWFGWRRALVCSVLACLPIAALVSSSSLPGWSSRRVVQRISWSPLCLLIGILAFILSTLFGYKLRPAFLCNCGEAETCFYDRVCINQETAELKRAGILKLPATLKASRKMLVLHSQIYFSRLWTCFEFCSFLMLKGPESVRILPENYVRMCAELTVAYTSYVVSKGFSNTDIFAFQRLYDTNDFFVTLFDKVVLLGFFGCLFRQAWQWTGNLLRVELQLSRLKISECCCTDDSDRPIVEGHLVLLAKRRALVDEHASHEESLAAFEVFVRNTGTSMLNVYGGAMVPYVTMVGVCMANILDGIEVLARSVQQGQPIRKITMNFLAELAFPFFVAPLSFRAYLHAALNLRARQGVGWISLAVMELCVPGLLGIGLELLGYGQLDDQLKAYIDVESVFYVYLGALFIVTTFLYAPIKFKRCPFPGA